MTEQPTTGERTDAGKAALILVLGREHRNLELLAQMLRAREYDVEVATSVEDFDELVGVREDIALAIIDATGFDEDVWRRCEQLDALGVAMLILAGSIPPEIREQAYSRGVHALMEKPVDKADLQATIRGLLNYVKAERGRS